MTFPTLTKREREIATRIAYGATNRQIGESLDISVKTVDTHRAHILKKLGLRHNVDLAHHAIAHGYIEAQR